MKLQFDTHQDCQLEAIRTVVALFELMKLFLFNVRAVAKQENDRPTCACFRCFVVQVNPVGYVKTCCGRDQATSGANYNPIPRPRLAPR